MQRFVVMDYGLIILLMQVTIAMAAQVQDIDNGIVGEPEVKCGSDNVRINFRTRKQFNGKTFVQGHYADPDCKVDHSSIDGLGKSNESNVSITLHHGACDMQRQRMISPRGMQMSTVVVISFHKIFITAVDKAYNIKCMYRERDYTVSAGMEVSALTTATITSTFPMPQCSYTIRKDEIDGEILKYAKVGEQVVHRWQCDTDVFGILVHSCYVEDGQSQRVYIVDENGCHRDRYILGDPTYVEKLNMAYRESHVFKFADRLTVRFQCQIRLCVKFDDGCRGVTPPICSSAIGPAGALLLGNATGALANSTLARSSSNMTRSLENAKSLNPLRRKRTVADDGRNSMFDLIDGDFTSQDLYVLESTEDPDNGSSKSESLNSLFQPQPFAQAVGVVCLSLPAFSSLMTLVLLAIMSATLSGFYLIFLHVCRKRMPHLSHTRRQLQ